MEGYPRPRRQSRATNAWLNIRSEDVATGGVSHHLVINALNIVIWRDEYNEVRPHSMLANERRKSVPLQRETSQETDFYRRFFVHKPAEAQERPLHNYPRLRVGA
jgi:hypothetical protein